MNYDEYVTLTKHDLTAITGIVQVETKKIVNGQSAMKSELLGRIEKLRIEMDKKFGDVDKRFDKLDERIDKIGLSVAQLQDDAPTIEEFDKLEKRVKKIEVKVASI
jgi:tetrahydromethanopterin S-methyltransferase subunit G